MIEKIHHIGIAVHDLEKALEFYRDTLGLHVHASAEVQDQGLKAALLTIGQSEIELLEPLSPDSPVGKFVERKGEGLHHICFQTPDVDAELEGLKAKDVPLVDQKPRKGLAGMIGFLHPKASRGVLVELATPPDETGEAGHHDRAVAKRIDHVVIATADLRDAERLWERNLGLRADASLSQPLGAGFEVARLPIGDAFLELVQPVVTEGRFYEQFQQRGEGMFSISVEVDDLDGAVEYLRGKRIKVSDPEASIWPGARLARISHDCTHGVSIQLIERK